MSLSCILGSSVLLAQPTPTTSEDLMEAISIRKEMADSSPLTDYPVRSIGPIVQGARITDLAVNEANPKHFYVAYASGGVFETKNNGQTFTPIFDHVGALTIGSLALAPSDPKVIYVGTGESNSSRSSYAGSGVYKSTDGGQSWEHLGLGDTQHIGRVLVHPTDPNTAWVASIGALYTHNEARGVYKTTDGGATWEKTLFVNDSTGIIELSLDPQNPNNLLAASWERTRKAWDFKGNGPGSTIYRSTDGGDTWSQSAEGFPQDDKVGRIGFSYHYNDPSIVYAVMDYQKEIPGETEEEPEGLQFKDFLDLSVEDVKSLGSEELGEFLEDNRFPEKYTAEQVIADLENGKYTPADIANYSGDANAALFNTSVAGASVYKSTDGGKTWAEVEGSPVEGVFFTYGYYFAQIRVDPVDPDRIFVHGVPLIASEDGGKTWALSDMDGEVHADHHAQWINPKDPKHIILGNDGGLYLSYDGGTTWDHINNTSTGQFYTVAVDMEEPYNVYGGLQDNGSLRGSSESVPGRTEFWERMWGGDGMYVFADPRDISIVYAGLQFGNYVRIDREARKLTRITPQHDIGEPVLRFNWRTPVVMSPHNPDIIYFGSQRLHRSLDQGETWDAISPDLTKDLPQGNVPHSTLSWIAESPGKFGVIYVGTDDGMVWVTQNGGADWENISDGLPEGLWVSSVVASPHDIGTVFVTLNGYRFDDFHSYVFMSRDFGKTWTSLAGNLPEEVANVIIQDLEKPELLFLGTDGGTYVSTNSGQEWSLMPGIPNVASYDMVVHPRDNDLVVATHGRSIYVSNIEPMRKLVGSSTSTMVFGDVKLRHSERWGESRYPFSEVRTPKASQLAFIGSTSGLKAEILNEDGIVVRTLAVDDQTGFQTLEWDVMVNLLDRKNRPTGEEEYASKGEYTLRLTAGGSADSVKVILE